jgi:hypothetical protein
MKRTQRYTTGWAGRIASRGTWLVFAVAIAMALCTAALAGDDKDFEGTQKAELAKLTLPQPSTIKVAILPFWDYKSEERHIEEATKYTEELLGVHGFTIVPGDAVAKAVKEDKEIEPGQPFRRSDAVHMGTALGADWVIYGEIYELETYVKTSFFSARKKGKVSMKIAVVDVASQDVLYWHKRSDTSGGTAFCNFRRASSIEGKACRVCLDRAFEMLLKALPEHEIKPAGEQEEDE